MITAKNIVLLLHFVDASWSHSFICIVWPAISHQMPIIFTTRTWTTKLTLKKLQDNLLHASRLSSTAVCLHCRTCHGGGGRLSLTGLHCSGGISVLSCWNTNAFTSRWETIISKNHPTSKTTHHVSYLWQAFYTMGLQTLLVWAVSVLMASYQCDY